MDGTTAGNLGFAPPQPPADAGGNLSISRTPAVADPAIAQPTPMQQPVQPVSTPSTQQPQYSQVTPVYAPGPTNAVTDIPQPAVKGIEFVKAPAAPIQPPTDIKPVTPQPVTSSQLASTSNDQPIQPILPPPLPPMPSAQSTQPVASTTDTPTASGNPEIDQPSESSMQKIENVDLDQLIGAVPATPVDSPQAAPTPQTANTNATATNSYFPSSPEGDIVLVNNKKFSINKPLVIRIAIIVGALLVVSVGGYFVVNMITNQAAPSTTTTTIDKPVVTQPSFNEVGPSTTTDTTSTDTTTTDTTSTDDTSTVPLTDTTTTPSDTTTAPAVVTPPPSESTTTADTTTPPAVSNTGLEW